MDKEGKKRNQRIDELNSKIQSLQNLIVFNDDKISEEDKLLLKQCIKGYEAESKELFLDLTSQAVSKRKRVTKSVDSRYFRVIKLKSRIKDLTVEYIEEKKNATVFVGIELDDFNILKWILAAKCVKGIESDLARNNYDFESYKDGSLDRFIKDEIKILLPKYDSRFNEIDKIKKTSPKVQNKKDIVAGSKPRKNYEQDAYIFVDGFVKYKTESKYKDKNITFELIEDFTRGHLHSSTWNRRFHDNDFIKAVYNEIEKRLRSGVNKSKDLITIYTTDLPNYLSKYIWKNGTQKYLAERKKSNEAKLASQYKEKKEADFQPTKDGASNTMSAFNRVTESQNDSDLLNETNNFIDGIDPN